MIAATPRRRRGAGLAPLIDVVFLLLVFFLLVARDPGTGRGIPVFPGGAGTESGVPRLIEIEPDSARLNGIALEMDALTARAAALAQTHGTVFLRTTPEVSLQRLVDVMRALRNAGVARQAVVE